MNKQQCEEYLDARRQGTPESMAATAAGVSWMDVIKYRQDHQDFAEAERLAVEEAAQLVEDALFQAASSGNVQAIALWQSRGSSTPSDPLKRKSKGGITLTEEETRNPKEGVWSRQEREPVRAFAYFCTYRDMGHGRTLKKVAEQYGISETRVGQLSTKWSWGVRCKAWETERDRLAREAEINEIQVMARRHAGVAMKFIERLNERIESFDVADIKPADMSRWLEVASKVERQARGEPVEGITVSGPGGGPVVFEHASPTIDNVKAIMQVLDEAGVLDKEEELEEANG